MSTLTINDFNSKEQNFLTSFFKQYQDNGIDSEELIKTKAGINLLLAFENDLELEEESIKKLKANFENPTAEFNDRDAEITYKFYSDDSFSFENSNERLLDPEATNWFSIINSDGVIDFDNAEKGSADQEAYEYAFRDKEEKCPFCEIRLRAFPSCGCEVCIPF